MNIYEKLLNIQMELKTPKSQWNDFGKYYFRSCEDILEAVKPLCKKNNTILYLNDMVENKGERYYLKAEAVLVDIEKPEDKIVATAEARECLTKKGMDESQITGTASSYARKYALDGLFGIDDTKDADSNEYNKADKDIKKKETPADESNKVTNNKEQNKITEQPISKMQLETFKIWSKNKNIAEDVISNVLLSKGYKNANEIKNKDYRAIVLELNKILKQGENQ